MIQQGDYILWLPSWYPNRMEPLNGDFIQRHARAVAAYKPIVVIHLVRDAAGIVTKNTLIDEKVTGNLTEIVLYYHIAVDLPQPVMRLISMIYYHKHFKKTFRRVLNNMGLPRLVHVHVALNAGMHALWLKKHFGLKYLVSEHWSGYLPDAKPGLKDVSAIFRMVLKKVFLHASGISAVSQTLGAEIQKQFSLECRVIPNLVDTDIFVPAQQAGVKAPILFIHISTLNYPKNPEAILEGFSLFKRQAGQPFLLRIVGPESTTVKKLASSLGLEQETVFLEETSQDQLVPLINQSDALVLFSRFETFGCVVIEANACGIPVIVSDIPVFRENVQHELNGLIAKGRDPQSLANVLQAFLSKRGAFSKEKIREMTIKRFGSVPVGQQFIDWYRKVEGNDTQGS